MHTSSSLGARNRPSQYRCRWCQEERLVPSINHGAVSAEDCAKRFRARRIASLTRIRSTSLGLRRMCPGLLWRIPRREPPTISVAGSRVARVLCDAVNQPWREVDACKSAGYLVDSNGIESWPFCQCSIFRNEALPLVLELSGEGNRVFPMGHSFNGNFCIGAGMLRRSIRISAIERFSLNAKRKFVFAL